MKRAKAFILQQFGRKNLRKQESYEHKKEGFVNTFLFFSPNASIFNSNVLRGHEALPSTLEHHSRLVRTRLGHYYLCVPKPLDIRGESQAPPEQKHATMALDPGVRTFMTGYDADGAVYEWGEADMGRIYRLCHTLDDLQSRWSGANVRHHQRYRMKVTALPHPLEDAQPSGRATQALQQVAL